MAGDIRLQKDFFGGTIECLNSTGPHDGARPNQSLDPPREIGLPKLAPKVENVPTMSSVAPYPRSTLRGASRARGSLRIGTSSLEYFLLAFFSSSTPLHAGKGWRSHTRGFPRQLPNKRGWSVGWKRKWLRTAFTETSLPSKLLRVPFPLAVHATLWAGGPVACCWRKTNAYKLRPCASANSWQCAVLCLCLGYFFFFFFFSSLDTHECLFSKLLVLGEESSKVIHASDNAEQILGVPTISLDAFLPKY